MQCHRLGCTLVSVSLCPPVSAGSASLDKQSHRPPLATTDKDRVHDVQIRVPRAALFPPGGHALVKPERPASQSCSCIIAHGAQASRSRLPPRARHVLTLSRRSTKRGSLFLGVLLFLGGDVLSPNDEHGGGQGLDVPDRSWWRQLRQWQMTTPVSLAARLTRVCKYRFMLQMLGLPTIGGPV